MPWPLLAGNCERGLPGSGWASGPARTEHRVPFATTAESARPVRRRPSWPAASKTTWSSSAGSPLLIVDDHRAGSAKPRPLASSSHRGGPAATEASRVAPLRALTPAVVREWHASVLRGRGGRVSIQRAYRFLRAVMNTAVRDGAIVKNLCQTAGAGTDRAKERPVATPAEVVALVKPSLRGTGLPCCLPLGAGCAGERCSACAARTSTSRLVASQFVAIGCSARN